MKKTIFEYHKRVGKTKYVSSSFALSGRAQKVYNVLGLIAFIMAAVSFILATRGIISVPLAILLFIIGIVPAIVVPIAITLKDKGKEAVQQEIEQNKVTEVFDSSAKEPVYIKSQADTIPTVIDKGTTVKVIDDTGSERT
ncbi:MAG: DUF805 domain-containing protein [Clostridiaceae bacterium]|nr:DUF805 domain-containing protein [Clostridiaceae bacterium]